MIKKYEIGYKDIVSSKNLFSAWEEFIIGKRKRKDVQEFGSRPADNILELHRDLVEKTYKHGPYEHFIVTDPKRRDIHKASVRDRLVHHALHRKLYPYFILTTALFMIFIHRGRTKAHTKPSRDSRNLAEQSL